MPEAQTETISVLHWPADTAVPTLSLSTAIPPAWVSPTVAQLSTAATEAGLIEVEKTRRVDPREQLNNAPCYGRGRRADLTLATARDRAKKKGTERWVDGRG